MNCPNCKIEIGKDDLVCPNCKKVLKLQCHFCGAISKNSICEKCGSVIINKCYKCGKLNTTNQTNCPKCGMDINASIGLKESFIEEFAGLTIEFSNFEEIKSALKSEKLCSKFKKNIHEIIKKAAIQKKLRVQLHNDTIIIRFCKDYTFQESCKSAIDFAIFVAQTVTEINRKLFEAKGLEIKVQMAILKRDIYAKPSEYKSGLNINVVYSSNDSLRKLNSIEVVADSYVYQAVKEDYPFQSLSAIQVKNQMIMFFELILTKLIKIEPEQDLEFEEIKLPQNIDYEPDEKYLNEQLIHFKALNCSFIYTKQTKLIKDLQKIAQKDLNTPIISIRSPQRLGKLGLTDLNQLQEIFTNSQLCRITCSPLNKYNAYGLFKQIVMAYKNIDEININSNIAKINNVFEDQYLKDLFSMQTESQEYPEDFRYSYFEVFSKFLATIPYKTLFVIDDIENADDASIEILKYIYESNILSNVGFIVSSEKEFVLHRKIYKLMTDSNYFDIEIMPSSNKDIVNHCKDSLKEIKNTFFFEKVLENTKGSLLYFKQALNYLVDKGILSFENGIYVVAKEKMLVIPSNEDELIKKRIQSLKIKPNLLDLYSYLVLLGESTSLPTILALNIKDLPQLLKQLQAQDFIEITNENTVTIKNYTLFRKNLLELCDKEKLKDYALYLLESIYINSTVINTNKGTLLELAELKKEAFAHWHALAMTSSRFGDFCAYLNCTNKFLSLVDNVIDENTDKTVNEVKFDVYSELANIMYRYYPDKIIVFLKSLLKEIEANNDNEKIKEISNKLLQSCLMSGYYTEALEYAGKIISRTPKSSFDPQNRNFNLNYFFLNLVTLEVYFNLGRLEECIDLGNDLFKKINIKEFKELVLPEEFSKQGFDDAIFDAQVFYILSLILKGKTNVQTEIAKFIKINPANTSCFLLLETLIDAFQGLDINQKLESIEITDKYSSVIFYLLQSIIAYREQDWEKFGNCIYNAKVQASIHNIYQAKFLCDALIGLTYLYLNNTAKAKKILYNVVNLTEERGLKTITYLCWYLIAKAEFTTQNTDLAINILNNNLLNLEKDYNTCEIILILFKTFITEIILNSSENIEQALFLSEQAFDLAYKTKSYIYIPKIANILMYIYNTIVSNQNDEFIQKQFTQKIQILNNTIEQLNNH